jgi:hypothetical protein
LRATHTVLTESLKRALDDALATVHWVAGFDFPDHVCAADLLALRAGDRQLRPVHLLFDPLP